ncbi:MAG: guanine deaminase [Oligoflexus sp.]
MSVKVRAALTAYRGKVLTLTESSVPGNVRCQVWDDGCLIVDQNGLIVEVGPCPSSFADDTIVHDLRPYWLLPSFIDSHIHFCQLDLIGCYAGELLQWLSSHTFPHEQALMEDEDLLRGSAQVFVDQLLIHGTSFACIYGPSQTLPTKILLEELAKRGIRAIVGKASMDRHAPSGLLDSIENDLAAHEALYQSWHNHQNLQRLFYAITPRFAPSCSDDMMRCLGDFKKRNPDVYVQTHYAENLDEIRWIHELYPQTLDYLAVYEDFNLIGPKTLLGHGIHVSPDERHRLSQSGATIVHCPTSNMFLGSGLCPVNWLQEGSVKLSLGTDVGAGTSFSLWQTMAEAYKVAKLRGESLTPEELFYLSTLGAADNLGFRGSLGSLSQGKRADFQVIDPSQQSLFARRLDHVHDVQQLLFAFMHHCDDRCVAATYVDGQKLSAPYKA